MTKKRSAKNAFISSLVMLCLCVTMLVGTTFAWYTDSVTSGRNTIVAGSLDITVEYFKSGTAFASGTWEEVTNTTKLFDDSAMFEPGATQVAYVRVKNTGDLAFKYKLSIAVDSEVIGKNKTGGDIKLSDYLYYGTAAATAPYGARSEAISAVETNKAPIASAQLSESQLLTANATSGVIAIVIYMPEDTGNEANPDPAYKPSITFGLNAIATQYTEESDSFNNQYDANAEYPAPAEASQTVTDASAPLVVEAGDYSVTVPVDALTAGDVYTVKASDVAVETSSAGEETISFDLSLYKNNVKVENETAGISYPVQIDIGAGKTVTGVKHNGVAMNPSDYTYNSTTGILSFTVDHFSPFEISFYAPAAKIGDTLYPTLMAAIDAVPDNGTATINVLRDEIGSGLSTSSLEADIHKKNLTIDFGGYTYTMKDPAVGSTGTKTQAMHWADNTTIVLKNGSFKIADNAVNIKMAMQNYSDLTIQNMTMDFSVIAVRNYGTYTGADAKYSGLEIPIFNSIRGSMTIENSTIMLPAASTKGMNVEAPVTMTNTTINGPVSLNSDNGDAKVTLYGSCTITKGVGSYFEGDTVYTFDSSDYPELETPNGDFVEYSFKLTVVGSAEPIVDGEDEF